MKIGVLGNVKKVKNENVIHDIVQFIRSLGYETTRFASPKEIVGVDVVIVLGGDGAILHSAVIAARQNINIIGINYGNLGFLTEYEKDEKEKIKELLFQIENGSCRVLKRTLLQCETQGKIFFALNEIALQRDSGLYAEKPTQILKTQVKTKEGEDSVCGDGVLICTPTGSTAYSLSAGGAILTPEVPVFMMTPICAFSMRTRPVVYSDNETVTLKITRGKGILLSDGLAVAGLSENAEITVKKAPFTANFPVRESSDFFAKVRNKLNE